MTFVEDVFDKAAAIERRWEHRVDVRFRWRIGRDAYMELAETAGGPPEEPPNPSPWSFHRKYERQERVRMLKAAWPTDTATLIGWPVICDEEFSGIEPEVVLR